MKTHSGDGFGGFTVVERAPEIEYKVVTHSWWDVISGKVRPWNPFRRTRVYFDIETAERNKRVYVLDDKLIATKPIIDLLKSEIKDEPK